MDDIILFTGLIVPFVSASTAIVVSILMITLVKKFGQGILASGFKKIALGVLLIALAVLIDATISSFSIPGDIAYSVLFVGKYLLFSFGIYVIYSGSKRTSDQLDSLIKK